MNVSGCKLDHDMPYQENLYQYDLELISQCEP